MSVQQPVHTSSTKRSCKYCNTGNEAVIWLHNVCFQDELFQLVTDQGFLSETNVVWETLSNVEGDCHFVDSYFRTYTKPEPPPLQMEPSNVEPNSDEQIDQE